LLILVATYTPRANGANCVVTFDSNDVLISFNAFYIISVFDKQVTSPIVFMLFVNFSILITALPFAVILFDIDDV